MKSSGLTSNDKSNNTSSTTPKASNSGETCSFCGKTGHKDNKCWKKKKEKNKNNATTGNSNATTVTTNTNNNSDDPSQWTNTPPYQHSCYGNTDKRRTNLQMVFNL